MMIRRTLILLASVALAIITTVAITPSASGAKFEWNYAKTPSAGGGSTCVYDPSFSAYGCYRPYGDYWSIKDTNKDGYRVLVGWRNYESDGQTLYRKGACVSTLGAGVWGECNKNYREGSLLKFRVCTANKYNKVISCSGWYGEIA